MNGRGQPGNGRSRIHARQQAQAASPKSHATPELVDRQVRQEDQATSWAGEKASRVYRARRAERGLLVLWAEALLLVGGAGVAFLELHRHQLGEATAHPNRLRLQTGDRWSPSRQEEDVLE